MAILKMYSTSMIVFLISIFLFHVLKFRRKFWIQVFHGPITNNTLLLPRDWPICLLKISKGLEKRPEIWQNLDPNFRKSSPEQIRTAVLRYLFISIQSLKSIALLWSLTARFGINTIVWIRPG